MDLILIGIASGIAGAGVIAGLLFAWINKKVKKAKLSVKAHERLQEERIVANKNLLIKIADRMSMGSDDEYKAIIDLYLSSEDEAARIARLRSAQRQAYTDKEKEKMDKQFEKSLS